MSVIPEPVSRKDEEQSDSIISDKTQTHEESFLLPSILRGAAYISSGGRVYRLFSDNDEISFPTATFEETLQFDPLPEIPPIDDFVSPLEDISEEYLAETFSGSLSDFSADSVKNRFTPPSILQLKQQPPTLPITENCPQEQQEQEQEQPASPNLPSKEKCSPKSETYKIFSENEQEEPANTTTPTPLYPITQEKTALKLFEAFPELTLSSDLPLAAVPAKTVPAKTVSAETHQSITTTPVVQMIRLEVPLRSRKQKHCFNRLPLHQQEKIQHSPPDQYNTAKPVVVPPPTPTPTPTPHAPTPALKLTPDKDRDIDPVTQPFDAGAATPPVTEPSLPEPSLPEPSLPEPSLPEPPLPEQSLPESKPNTLLFPFNEALPVGAGGSYKDGFQKHGGTWQLIWRSHWPEYLKSLELAASDQICFLADHLEIQKEQGRSVISFNSFQPGDGCTTLSLCAARELAERGYRLLLVDAHRQNPELPQLLHLKTNPDFYEIITLIPDRLELLPWSETSIEINSGFGGHITQSFGEVVGSFRGDYDFILLDNGSLVESPLREHVVLWREMCTDGVLLVLNMKSPPLVGVRAIAQRLFQNQINLLGIVENYV